MVDHKTIVAVCMDGSKHSDYAFEYYMEKIHRPDNEVHIIHCGNYKAMESLSMSMAPADPGLLQSVIDDEENKIREIMEHIKQKLLDYHQHASISRIHGNAAHVLLHKCNDIGAKMIVIGSRGQGKLRRTFLGSVSDYIVHHAHVPVIVCKHESHFHPHHGHTNH
ncbi:universal stress protein Sll1388-like [Ylistrum balloti]|uniref:universal stress protein Sll1388-like n=1 Tax=Ylistrum balloti TaxID=509963 RepID=UPI002905DB20|nr:universal stress protein Sll1388-like [Ylistrum balloti]